MSKKRRKYYKRILRNVTYFAGILITLVLVVSVSYVLAVGLITLLGETAVCF
jgi:hypothetical protein